MIKTRLAPGIFVLRFKTQHTLAATFLRIQEHYESSRFRGRVFSLEEFMDWYADRFGAFTYYQDWSGFNVPSTALRPFYRGRFDPLSRKERRLLSVFRNEREPFYIIGITEEGDLRHEIAHALYFMRPDYRKEVRAAMRRHDTSALRQKLAAMGYHRHVLLDEAHAYLVGGELRGKGLRGLARELRAIYSRYAPALRP